MSYIAPIVPLYPAMRSDLMEVVRKEDAPSPEDWARHRPLIKRLYLDENNTLKEVIRIMSSQYGHKATPKMYKDRIHQWGFDKKHKERDMLAILRKKTERDAIGKLTTFRVRGRTVTIEQFHHYFKRKKNIQDQQAYDAPTPSDVSYRTPSPVPVDISTKNNDNTLAAGPFSSSRRSTRMEYSSFPTSAYNFEPGDQELPDGPCFVEDEQIIDMTIKTMYSLIPSYPSIPGSPSAPHTLLIPEHLFYTIKTYVDGSFEKGTWVTDDRRTCILFAAQANETSNLPFDFSDYCLIAIAFLKQGRNVDFRRTISKAFGLVKDIIRSKQPHSLDCFLNIILFFRQVQHPELAKMLREYICEVATSLCTQDNPWARIVRLIAILEEDALEEAVVQSWRCVIDGYERALGSFHQTSLYAGLDFIYRVHRTVDYVEEERLLRGLLIRCEGELGVSTPQTLCIRIKLGWNLIDQGRYVEAEALKLLTLSQAEQQDSHVKQIQSLEITARSYYYQDKRTLAENILRQAVELAVDKWGADNPWSINLALTLEKWLCGWGREGEAYELRSKIEEAIGRDEIDQELDGH